ncbi:hypothetical protein MNBD_CHLOROFLEXI01-1718 [hydrothermal vent metagenome]|uniref:Polymerase nucleotidyl transferase domain-containing protein n=1 Tax=hydrothermal vent metagenome TaxID=652676 RepID=A0A3B0V340_9ZZZZ
MIRQELPKHLEQREHNAIFDCSQRLKVKLANSLVNLQLFGSKARGDFNEDSDIDLLVIIAGLKPPIRWLIYEVAADCSLQYDVLINTHVLDKQRWDEIERHQDTLWREIERDGVPLLDLTPITAQ